MRVIADHMRASTFLIADGVIPSNEWRGYVLRKIMRRAMRHGKKLGITQPFMHELADRVVAEMGDGLSGAEGQPRQRGQRDPVEEERFDAVLTAGLGRLEQVLERAGGFRPQVVPGDEVFRLYDSLGLPLDFIEDLASERQLAVDRAGYERGDGSAARTRPRRQPLRDEAGAGLHRHVGRRRRRARRDSAIASRATSTTRVADVHGASRCSTRRAQQVRSTGRRRQRLRGARIARRSMSKRRPGVGHGHV